MRLNDGMIFDHRAPEADDLVAELLSGRLDLSVYGQDIGGDGGRQRTDLRLKLGLGFRDVCANITQRSQDQTFGLPTYRLSFGPILSLLASRRDHFRRCVNAGAKLHRFPEQNCINNADENGLEHGLFSWASGLGRIVGRRVGVVAA